MSGIVRRTLLAATVAAVGVACAIWLGAQATAALLACLAGMGAFALARGVENRAQDGRSGASSNSLLPELGELLDAVDQPILIIQDRRVRLANRPALALLGEHILGGDIRLAIRHPAAAERFQAIPAPGVSETTELVGLGEAETHWTMSITGLQSGRFLVRLTDLSASRAVEQVRADFVANASHELRTPLANLLGFIETLEEDDVAGDTATRKRFLGIMSDEAKRMRNLIEDLMSLSRVESERFSPPRETIDLVSLLQHVMGDCRAFSESRGSALTFHSELGSALMTGDSAQLRQLFNNLITNALKYGKSGEPVAIQLDESGKMLRVRVIDRGEGIAAEHLPRLTERFYRVDPGRSRAGGGTGLGLAIAKHIAQRHRGRLEILSKVGQGTSVRVYLPRLDPADSPRLSSNRHIPVTEDSPTEPSE